MGGRWLLRTFSRSSAAQYKNHYQTSQRAVEALLEEPDLMDALSDALKGMPDIERLCSRVATGRTVSQGDGPVARSFETECGVR